MDEAGAIVQIENAELESAAGGDVPAVTSDRVAEVYG